jgi:hypothetical protein
LLQINASAKIKDAMLFINTGFSLISFFYWLIRHTTSSSTTIPCPVTPRSYFDYKLHSAEVVVEVVAKVVVEVMAVEVVTGWALDSRGFLGR